MAEVHSKWIQCFSCFGHVPYKYPFIQFILRGKISSSWDEMIENPSGLSENSETAANKNLCIAGVPIAIWFHYLSPSEVYDQIEWYIDFRLQKEGMPFFFLILFVLLFFYCYHYCSFSCCSCSASSLSWFCWYCCCLFVWCLFAWSLSEYFQAAQLWISKNQDQPSHWKTLLQKYQCRKSTTGSY